MNNFTTKARHNLPGWQTDILEKELNPEWSPSDGYAPISVAFLMFHKTDSLGFYAVLYENGQHHSVKYFAHDVFDVPAPTLKAA